MHPPAAPGTLTSMRERMSSEGQRDRPLAGA
jgi:hypothetical protein